MVKYKVKDKFYNNICGPITPRTNCNDSCIISSDTPSDCNINNCNDISSDCNKDKCDTTIKEFDIVSDLNAKFPSKEIGIVYPILSRNRFSMILKAIARAMDKVTILLSFPSDEVGNGIMDENLLSASPFNLGSLISEEDYEK